MAKAILTGLSKPTSLRIPTDLQRAEEVIWQGSHPATVKYALCTIAEVDDAEKALPKLKSKWSELKYESMSDAKIIREAIRRVAQTPEVDHE